MPTFTTPPITRIARATFEVKVLRALAEAPPEGFALGELRDRFPGQAVTHTLEHLADRGQVDRFPGLVYGIAALGRSRLAPPRCVGEVSPSARS